MLGSVLRQRVFCFLEHALQLISFAAYNLVLFGLIYKASPMVASDFLLRLRPYPVRGHRLLLALQHRQHMHAAILPPC